MKSLLWLLLAAAVAAAASFEERREAMVAQLAAYAPDLKVRDPRVLGAMRRVPRHEFVPPALAVDAYADSPLPIGEGQTISQPLIVGFMTELLELKPGDKVLEIGAGSGYQAAVLSLLAKEVYTIEIVRSLGRRAEKALKRLGYRNVSVRIGDGYRGWPEKAPFDAVIVTCAPDHIPPALVEQTKVGGRLVIPVGDPWKGQELYLVRRTETGTTVEKKLAVRFVPMTGEALKKK